MPFIFPCLLVDVWARPNNGMKYCEPCRQGWKIPLARSRREINNLNAQNLFSLSELHDHSFLKFSCMSSFVISSMADGEEVGICQ